MSDDDIYTDYSEGTYNDKLDEIHSTLEEIRDALPRLQSSSSSVTDWLFVFFIVFCFAGWSGSRLDRWTDRVWYSWNYDADWSQVNINKRPLDCDFTHAPLGNKCCSYKKNTMIFGDAERKKLLQEATTAQERQEITTRPNSVILFWMKKDD